MITSLCALVANAQSDSVTYLDEVQVLGTPLTKYSAGTSIKSISLEGTGGIDMIGAWSAINFKTYGNGQLATVSLRGTSASHTSVIWNGLPVNSPNLGQTDFSVWPAFLADEVIIQKGSASSLFGSGSIGGSVILENSLIREDSLLTLKLGVGSFGNHNVGAKIQLKPSEKIRVETRVFGSQIENGFPYEFNGSRIRQPNANVERFGISQKATASFSNHQMFSEVAFVTNDRQIQPSVTSTSRDKLLTKNLRGVISDEAFFGNTILYSSIGYVGESTTYNDTSITQSSQLIGNLSADVHINKSVSSRTGVNYIFTEGRSENYLALEKDHQYHFFTSIRLSLLKNVEVTLNLREAIHQSKAVFVPSLGGEWKLLDNGSQLVLKGQLSRGYRVPTFNDRFWRPGGNPDLLPETSTNQEMGISFHLSNLHQFSLTGFKSKVEEWIQWQPVDGIWTPRNIRQVKVHGLEFSGSSRLYDEEKVKLDLINEYEYTRSSDEGIEEDNQLPYIPKHALSSALSLSSPLQNIRIQTNYTGERFSTLTNSTQSGIDHFLLVDLFLTRRIRMPFASIQTTFSVHNLFNVSYEVLKNTAMPGRNFLIQLTIKH